MKTVNLELSKQLKEAGYPQKSYFMWDGDGNLRIGINGVQAPHNKTAYPEELSIEVHECFASPTADEILDQLPKEIIGDEGMRFDLNVYLGEGNQWVVCYWWDEDSRRKSGMFIKNIPDAILADAAAKMWLYLKKEGLL